MKTEVPDGNSVQTIKPQPTYFDLFQPRSLKTKIQAVVDQGAHLGVVAIIAHANDGNLRVPDQSNQLLQFKHVTMPSANLDSGNN